MSRPNATRTSNIPFNRPPQSAPRPINTIRSNPTRTSNAPSARPFNSNANINRLPVIITGNGNTRTINYGGRRYNILSGLGYGGGFYGYGGGFGLLGGLGYGGLGSGNYSGLGLGAYGYGGGLGYGNGGLGYGSGLGYGNGGLGYGGGYAPPNYGNNYYDNGYNGQPPIVIIVDDPAQMPASPPSSSSPAAPPSSESPPSGAPPDVPPTHALGKTYNGHTFAHWIYDKEWKGDKSVYSHSLEQDIFYSQRDGVWYRRTRDGIFIPIGE
jgi:hypothetical protein